jgi:hypothetical protein
MLNTNEANTVTDETPTPVDNWIDWFNSRESAEFVNKQAQEELFRAFNATQGVEECKKTLYDHQEVMFLFKETFGDQMNVFHHITETGGTVYDNDIEIGFIQGVEHDSSTFMTPVIETLCEKPLGAALAVPTATNILAITSRTDIDDLNDGTTTYKPRNFIPVPPFLCNTVCMSIKDNKGNGKDLLLAVVLAIKAFDSKYDTNDAYKNKAKQKCKEMLYWLFLASKLDSPVKATPTTVTTSRKLRDQLDQVLHQCLDTTNKIRPQGPPQLELANALGNQLKRPLEIIATSNSTQSDILRSFQAQHEKTNEKTSRSFTKLPAQYQNMILVASSQGEVTAMEINDQAKAFFKCSNQLSANVMLNCLLETKQIDCSVSSAMTQALMCGCFLWRNAVTPSGFAASAITSEDSLRNDTLHEGMVLDLSTKFEMSTDSLEKLTKTNVAYPSTIEGLIERLRAIRELSIFFFNEMSHASQGLTSLTLKFMDNKPLLRARAMVDDEFISKVICCVDDRLYQWLKQCARSTYSAQTTTELTNFGDIFFKILTNEFHYCLPNCVKKFKKPELDKTRKPGSPSLKKTRPNSAERIQNTAMNEDWKVRPNEKWETVFRHKSIQGPLLSVGCHPCLKFQCKGWCFKDCANKASHIKLKGDDKIKTDTFIKSLRGE